MFYQLIDLTGVRGRILQWDYSLSFFMALLISEHILFHIQVYFHTDFVYMEIHLPLMFLLRTVLYPLILTACALSSYRFFRRSLTSTTVAAITYSAVMLPIFLFFSRIGPQNASIILPLHVSLQRSQGDFHLLHALFSCFSWAFLILLGINLAVRYLKYLWLALGVGIAGGSLVNQIIQYLSLMTLRQEVNLSLKSQFVIIFYSLIWAILFATLFWIGLKKVLTEKPKLSKSFFLGSISAALVFMGLLFISRDKSLYLYYFPSYFPLVWVALLYIVVAMLFLIFKMWSAIQDGHASTTPLKAVGFLFIPLFNIYWAFRVFPGFVKDFNSYVDRYSLNIRKLPMGLFSAYVILCITPWIPVAWRLLVLTNIIVGFIMVSKICDAFNALHQKEKKT